MKTTAKQADLLKQLKLPVPPDSEIASRLLSFAIDGYRENFCFYGRPRSRRACIRAFWDLWVGKQVEIVRHGHRFQGACGVVVSLKARTEQEVKGLVIECQVARPIPFVAIVRLEPASARNYVEINLTGLKKVEQIQRRLFPP
jgi:hypothetical protein